MMEKPRIKPLSSTLWLCELGTVYGLGDTPADAYKDYAHSAAMKLVKPTFATCPWHAGALGVSVVAAMLPPGGCDG